MTWTAWLLLSLSFAATVLMTAIVRKLALRAGLLDKPNARSSHSVPTARGGGVAIVAACIPLWIALQWIGLIERSHAVALCVGGLAVAAVGFLDDRRGVDVRIRLAVHLAAAAFAVFAVGVPLIVMGESLAWFGWVSAVLGIGWFLNLFNFMDGIDSLAAGEATFMSLGGALLAIAADTSTSFAALAVAGAALGFLCWNWPPAKIFMGDVGSGFLGYALAVLALMSAQTNAGAMFAWLILAGVFLADSGVTLLRRLLRGQRAYEAHRSHAYQILARRWRNHGRVAAFAMAINVFWLLPLSWWAYSTPEYAFRLFLLAMTPLVVAVTLVGAGRDEALAPNS